MIRRKSSKMMDLEFMIPRDMKEERIYMIQEEIQEELEEDFREKAPFREAYEAHSGLREACCMCGRSSDESVLVPAFYCGRDGWICPKCLQSQGEPASVQTIASNPSPLFEDPTSSEPSGPMSMFD